MGVGASIARISRFSVPKHDPIHDAPPKHSGTRFLIEDVMFVIPLGMYASYSKWIKKEIDGAQSYTKNTGCKLVGT